MQRTCFTNPTSRNHTEGLEDKMKISKVTMISTLPPIKASSLYTLNLVNAISKKIKIDFIGFKKIYPEFLYPGGTIDKNTKEPKIKNVNIRSFLTWYNPFSWIWAGLTCKGKVIHAQWWSYVLAPIYFTILSIAKLSKKKIK